MNTQPEQPNIKDAVLNRLTRDSITPTPKMWFWCTECLVWVLWVTTVLLGAISMAIFCSALVTRSRDIFEATHDSAWQFLVTVIPFVWIGVFAAMTVLAVFYLRKTKRGYRYPVGQIVGSSLLFSIVGGAVLHFAGVGALADRMLGEQMPMYMSQEKMELKLWQAPEEGRLVGILTSNDENTTTLLDVTGASWTLNISELRQPDQDRLLSGEKVRLLGLPASTTNEFYACGVFPWMFDKAMPPKMISEERRAFLERMYSFMDEAERLKGLRDETLAGREMGRCVELKIIERIGDSM